MINTTLIFCLHEIGQRKLQQDSVWPICGAANATSSVFIVCDGVGGGAFGEIASSLTTLFLGKKIEDLKSGEITESAVRQLIDDSVRELSDYSRKNMDDQNMATTLAMMAIAEDKILIAWCGDSRIMQIRNGEIVYASEDHSLVAQLVKQGELTKEEAKVHPHRNIITRSLNSNENNSVPEIQMISDIQQGDFFLLCSDGVLENLDDFQIHSLFSKQNLSEEELRDYFKQLCFEKTKDNYSMYLVEISTNR